MVPIIKPVAKEGLKSMENVAKDQEAQALKKIAGGVNVKQVLKQREKTALKSFGWSSINLLAINTTQKRKKPQSQSRDRTVKRGLKHKAKNLIQLNVWYLKKIYLANNDATRFLRLHLNEIGYGVHSTLHDYHARHSVK